MIVSSTHLAVLQAKKGGQAAQQALANLRALLQVGVLVKDARVSVVSQVSCQCRCLLRNVPSIMASAPEL